MTSGADSRSHPASTARWALASAHLPGGQHPTLPHARDQRGLGVGEKNSTTRIPLVTSSTTPTSRKGVGTFMRTATVVGVASAGNAVYKAPARRSEDRDELSASARDSLPWGAKEPAEGTTLF